MLWQNNFCKIQKKNILASKAVFLLCLFPILLAIGCDVIEDDTPSMAAPEIRDVTIELDGRSVAMRFNVENPYVAYAFEGVLLGVSCRDATGTTVEATLLVADEATLVRNQDRFGAEALDAVVALVGPLGPGETRKVSATLSFEPGPPLRACDGLELRGAW